ncbi:MAG TPA: hypothetical protein PLO47_00805 [Bacillota bacterium]|nr:hypothetical protein [Bacillota bacterium]
MKKTILLVALLALSLSCFAACSKESEPYPGLDKLISLAQDLAKSYNEVAETAINNGWEYDDETVEKLDRIATVIETINAGIVAPETFTEGQIEVLTDSAMEFAKTLEELKKIVSEEYELPEEESPSEEDGTDGE